MTRFQITQWDESHENNKSRLYNKCNRAFFPCRMEGLGFMRLMAEPDGSAIYGVFHMMLAICTQQDRPRAGWLTEDGTAAGAPITAEDIALRIRRPVSEVQRTLDVLSTEKIGWISRHASGTESAEGKLVPAQCPPSARVVPVQCPRGAEDSDFHRSKADQCPSGARAVPAQCQKPDKEQNRTEQKEHIPAKKPAGRRTEKPASKKSANAWSLWVDLHRERGLADPLPAGPDTQASASIGRHIADPAELRRVLSKYLDDRNQWLVDNGHALRHLSGKLGKYQNGTDDSDADEAGEMAERLGRQLEAAACKRAN